MARLLKKKSLIFIFLIVFCVPLVYAYKCPAEMINVADYCIDADEHTSISWWDLAFHCSSENKKICSPYEWYNACNNNPVGLNNIVGNYEWVDSIHNSDYMNVMGRENCKIISWQRADDPRETSGRCCSPPLKGIRTRISSLEQINEVIWRAINALMDFLYFRKYEYIGGTICNAVENECGAECIDECSKFDKGCLSDNVAWYCEMQSDGCYDKVEVICDYDEYCDNGECSYAATTEVVFRTNVFDGAYYDCTLRSNCWIAFDFDNDNNLDALGFDGKSRSCSEGNTLLHTPEGYRIVDLDSGTSVVVCDDEGKASRFSTRRTAKNVELSKQPISPYSENNQEVYIGVA